VSVVVSVVCIIIIFGFDVFLLGHTVHELSKMFCAYSSAAAAGLYGGFFGRYPPLVVRFMSIIRILSNNKN
jgi:hypothetical protein